MTQATQEKICASTPLASTITPEEMQLQLGTLADVASRQAQEMTSLKQRVSVLEDLLRVFAGEARNKLPARSKN